MAIKTIVDIKDPNVIIGLTDTINEIETNVGFIKNSGLFVEELVPRETIIARITKASQRGMLGFTSRREKNKVMQQRTSQKAFAVQIPYQATTGIVGLEDIDQVAKSWDDATEEQVMDLYIEELTAQRESIDNAHEYIYWTAAQGMTRNPEDGSVILDMFDQMDVTRPTATLDLSSNTTNVPAAISAFRNRVIADNKRNTQIGIIDIFVPQAVYAALIAHPSVSAILNSAFYGRGQEYISRMTNIGTVQRDSYGITSTFEWDGVRFIVAPQHFILEDTNTEVPAVEAGKGFTVVRGIRDGFKAYFGQSNTLTGRNTLAKVYAQRSAIVDDSYFKITSESAPLAYTTIPELCYEWTFTL